jgi:aspartate 1-decarboxylase
MLRNFLRSKIHRATVTEANVDYIGSLAIDEELMELAGIGENEIVHLGNLSNGERLTTYAIKAPRGGRTICVNGAAALRMSVGDQIIIFAFGWYNEQEAKEHHPQLVFVDAKNNPILGATSESHAQTV